MRSPWKGESSPEVYSRHKETMINIMETDRDRHTGGRKTVNMIIRTNKNKKEEPEVLGDRRSSAPENERTMVQGYSKSEAKLKIVPR